MVHWGWLIFAFLCGMSVTVLFIGRVLRYVALHRLAWTSSTLKELYEKTEKLRQAKLNK